MVGSASKIVPFLVILSCVVGCDSVIADNEIETFQSTYSSILIETNKSIVEMRFRRRGTSYLESAVDVENPLNLIVPYTRTLFVGVFFRSDPRRVLLIGLGGGAFNHLFNAAFPKANLRSVELDPKVVDLAKNKMGFKESPENAVTVSDGRVFLKRDQTIYEWIILDAFRGGYVPSHLKTVEFYNLVKAHLDQSGLLLVNLHRGTALFPSDVATLRASFPNVCFFCVKNEGNVIAAATVSETMDLQACVAAFQTDNANVILRGRVDFEQLKQEKCAIAPDLGARVLTDDFAPAEYLDAITRENQPKD